MNKISAISGNESILKKTQIYLEMIKFSHTLFALPFALTGMILAANGFPEMMTFLLILLAMASGRTTAMLFNRITDAKIDNLNPRTKGRAIPAGLVDLKNSIIIAICCATIFLSSAYMLNWLCFALAPVPLIVFIIYPYTKRFTRLSHFVLGAALGMAPAGAWIAVTGELPPPAAFVLAGAVLFWVAGFDIIYAIQDIDFDRGAGFYSIPEKFGIQGAFFFARACHLVFFILLASLPIFFPLRGVYFSGMGIIALMLLYEHLILKINELSRIQHAFFNVNAAVSITMFLFTATDIFIRGAV